MRSKFGAWLTFIRRQSEMFRGNPSTSPRREGKPLLIWRQACLWSCARIFSSMRCILNLCFLWRWWVCSIIFIWMKVAASVCICKFCLALHGCCWKAWLSAVELCKTCCVHLHVFNILVVMMSFCLGVVFGLCNICCPACFLSGLAVCAPLCAGRPLLLKPSPTQPIHRGAWQNEFWNLRTEFPVSCWAVLVAAGLECYKLISGSALFVS